MTAQRLVMLVLAGIAIILVALADVSRDEFGRGQISAVGMAAGLSAARACAMSALLLVVSFVLVIVVEFSRSTVFSWMAEAVVDALDSVPIYIWILAAVSWSPRYANMLAVGVFVIAGLPLTFNAIRSAVRNIMAEPYFQAAISLGSGPLRLIRNHIIPNILPPLLPVAVHVFGAAIAVYGGIGVFGFVNRSELDLGVFLLRGKERAGQGLILLFGTIVAFVAIFFLLQYARRFAQGRTK
jgi:ABC-type dipeptide/oligopeptide/nickel transport system permease subunit